MRPYKYNFVSGTYPSALNESSDSFEPASTTSGSLENTVTTANNISQLHVKCRSQFSKDDSNIPLLNKSSEVNNSMEHFSASTAVAGRRTSVRPSSASSISRRSKYHIDRDLAQTLHEEVQRRAADDKVKYELEKKKQMLKALHAPAFEALEKSHEYARRRAEDKRKIQEMMRTVLEEEGKNFQKRRMDRIYERSQKNIDYLNMKSIEAHRKIEKEKRMKRLLTSASLPQRESFIESVDRAKQNEYTKQKREAIDGRKKRDEELKKRREESQRRREWALQGSQSQSQAGALDPEEVTERLQREQALFDNRVARRREASIKMTHKKTAKDFPKQVYSMEQREYRMQQRNKESKEARLKKQEEEELIQERKNKIHFELLQSIPLPTAALTNSVILRVEKVHQNLEKRRLDAEAKLEEQRKRELRRRDNLIARRTLHEIIQDEDERRRRLGSGYVSFFSIDQNAAEKARSMKRESEERCRASHDKLQQKLIARPSLMMRQKQEEMELLEKIGAVTRIDPEYFENIKPRSGE